MLSRIGHRSTKIRKSYSFIFVFFIVAKIIQSFLFSFFSKVYLKRLTKTKRTYFVIFYTLEERESYVIFIFIHSKVRGKKRRFDCTAISILASFYILLSMKFFYSIIIYLDDNNI